MTFYALFFVKNALDGKRKLADTMDNNLVKEAKM
jgi:hypothetical protein